VVLALVVLAIVLPGAIYLRNSSTTSVYAGCVAGGRTINFPKAQCIGFGRAAAPTYRKARTTWATPAALAIAIGGLALAVGISMIGVERRGSGA
jgi:hypothetical protein